INRQHLNDEATHLNIPAGHDKRSNKYTTPHTIDQNGNNHTNTANSCKNIAMQIVQQGTAKDELNLVRAQPQWYANMSQVSGFVLNKNETPFAPLYWDRYEQIKTLSR